METLLYDLNSFKSVMVVSLKELLVAFEGMSQIFFLKLSQIGILDQYIKHGMSLNAVIQERY